MKVAIISIINRVIEAAGSAISAIFILLPNSPFLWVEEIDSEVLEAINWILPISAMISHIQLYVVAVAIYYALRIALRWLKAAGG
ncbi:MAG: hypothetical protein GX786_00860 [Clostridiales bacterium]|nr:hypothetical protein [Clostridiales bacterium]